MFRKLGLFLSSDEGRETPTVLGPLEGANLNHWTVCSSTVFTIPEMDEVQNPNNSE
jgi:hypothetical protein